ncbi:Cut9-interacting protein scn1 [Sporothrix epigloea]|uniref:Cut9-interacting protein scn1 n=1 Tax=Sporothrix epigloea TaxID=1892477 RepID=A0ABP0DZ50_9PEZI
MCGQDSRGDHGQDAAVPLNQDPNADKVFPWDTGRVFDAHCHPTDTPASLAAISGMGAATLTVMSTRAQDQDLVAALAASEPVSVVPAFGWHPWFAHQLYDDKGQGGDDLVSLEAKRQHLVNVLAPMPSSLVQPVSARDQELVAALDALAASLPAIRPLSAFLAETRQRLLDHPGALVGEIGIDKAFRVPEPEDEDKKNDGVEAVKASGLTPGGREGRRLSPFRVQPAQQIAVLTAQLTLAAELQRPVSVHGVQAHGLLYSTLAATWKGQERELPSRRQRRQQMGDVACVDDERSTDEQQEERTADLPSQENTYPPSICLHSFSGPVDMLQQYLRPAIPATIYFSFSTAVNCSTASGCQRLAEVVAACPDDRLLVESDLHVAGADMDAALEDMYRRVCAIKQWTLDKGVERIAQNYNAFIQLSSRTKRL